VSLIRRFVVAHGVSLACSYVAPARD